MWSSLTVFDYPTGRSEWREVPYGIGWHYRPEPCWRSLVWEFSKEPSLQIAHSFAAKPIIQSFLQSTQMLSISNIVWEEGEEDAEMTRMAVGIDLGLILKAETMHQDHTPTGKRTSIWYLYYWQKQSLSWWAWAFSTHKSHWRCPPPPGPCESWIQKHFNFPPPFQLFSKYTESSVVL